MSHLNLEQKILSVFKEKRGFEILALTLGKAGEEEQILLREEAKQFSAFHSYLIPQEEQNVNSGLGCFKTKCLPPLLFEPQTLAKPHTYLTVEDALEEQVKRELQALKQQGFNFSLYFRKAEDLPPLKQGNRLHLLKGQGTWIASFPSFYNFIKTHMDLCVYILSFQEFCKYKEEFKRDYEFWKKDFPCYELKVLELDKSLSPSEKEHFVKTGEFPVSVKAELKALEQMFSSTVRTVVLDGRVFDVA